ncbi:(2Fe-2S)-binding protein [Pseudoroseicyclus tamaricis]|uniref:(2Fe-2S)-binding protein n=1 Tax=Pseudoroseicyclus tamaricis TaxID=2705421 RepID=A0A6B2JVV2_9RHOB|nr:(2Fe-2S)-binding protein [Pseudoroseicyclus tamaricis]NDV00344.1 (2Fe-2S)-binding protein [Pseudoroseicyclus tamaricis]
MIVCHCQSITDGDIRSAIDWMRASDPATIITPGKVYRALGKSAECGGCMSLFLDTMRRNDNLRVPVLPRPGRKEEGQTGTCRATTRSSTI